MNLINSRMNLINIGDNQYKIVEDKEEIILKKYHKNSRMWLTICHSNSAEKGKLQEVLDLLKEEYISHQVVQ